MRATAQQPKSWSDDRDSAVVAGHPHAPQSHARRTPTLLAMDDCRVTLLRARIAAHLSEVARLNAELEATLAARAAGVSPWGSELPPLILQRVLELLQWEPAVCGNVRAVCSTWSSLHDALRSGRLQPRRSLAVMEGKLGWLQSVTELNLTGCEDGVCGPLVELQSMLRSLSLPASRAESAVDADSLRRCMVSPRSPRCASWTCGRLTRPASPWRRWASGCWT
jgi:uncharacterized small protein (DUF1192 family)